MILKNLPFLFHGKASFFGKPTRISNSIHKKRIRLLSHPLLIRYKFERFASAIVSSNSVTIFSFVAISHW